MKTRILSIKGEYVASSEQSPILNGWPITHPRPGQSKNLLKRFTQNGYPQKVGTTFLPELLNKVTLVTAHVGQASDFLEVQRTRSTAVFFSSNQENSMEGCICMVCYIFAVGIDHLHDLFSRTGFIVTDVPAWKYHNPMKLYRNIALSTS